MSLRAVVTRFGLVLVVMALVASACTSTDSSRADDPDAEDGNTTDVEPDDDDDENTDDPDTPDEDVEFTIGSYSAPSPDPTRLDISDDIRMGVLDNGLTYFVRSNDSPGGSVALRLAVRAGGLHEDPVGTGAAHFLEHMMFNGTEQFPGATLDATLRSIGAEIGPDFNALTSANVTLYQLEVVDQGQNVDVAFDVLSEWASAALIEPEEVALEAPVVREELRVRTETGDGIIGVTFEEAYFRDTPYEGVSVTGSPESVNALTAEDLREFYDTWYRPDNMAIIAVGDRSLDDLEDEITERFADLTARGEIVAPPEVGDFPLRTEPLVEIVVDPTIADSFISVDIPVRAWDRSTVGGNELLLTEIVLSIAINNRLAEGVETGRLDLRRAGGGWFPYNDDLVYLGFNLDADNLVAGTEVFMAELAGTLQNPFSQADIDRAVEQLASAEEQRLAQVGSSQDSDLADEIAFTYLSGGDIDDVEASVERNLRFLGELSADEANNHWGWMMTSAAPIVLVVGPDAERVGDLEDIVAAVEAGSNAVVGELEDGVDDIDVLVKAPEPVREIESNSLDSGEVELVFANGHTVLFAESTISEGNVDLYSESPGGRSMLSADDGALAETAAAAVSASGLGEWNQTQIRRYLANIDAGVSPVITDFTEGFSGGAASEDVETLFQLVHLLATSPRVDEVPFAQRVEGFRDQVDLATLDSGFAAETAATNARTGGGNLASLPTLGQLDSLTPEDAVRIYTDRFSNLDSHVIAVVGDMEEDQLVDLARTWIGSLPPSGGIDEPDGYAPIGQVTERLSVGSGTSSGSFLYVGITEGEESVESLMVADVASRIVDDRLFTVIREQLGATYGGFSFTRYIEPGDDVDLIISVDGDPARIDEIADTVGGELKSMAGGNISDADFNEAIAIVDSELNFINNGFIIDTLFDEAAGGSGTPLNRGTQRNALEGITPADVSAFIDDILTSGESIDVRNVPAS